MTTVTLPSQDELNQLFSYDPEVGKLFWKPRPVGSSKGELVVPKTTHRAEWWNEKYAGKEAGGFRRKGYLTCSLLGKTRFVHRIVWKIVYGNDPQIIDHINGVRSDNRISNLRSVNPRQNAMNMRKGKRNTSGYIGVSFHKKSCRWVANIKTSRKFLHLGSFEKIEDAIEARVTAAAKYGYHQNHGR